MQKGRTPNQSMQESQQKNFEASDALAYFQSLDY